MQQKQNNWNEKIKTTTNYLRNIIGTKNFDLAVIMGTGLESFASAMEITHTIPYNEIPGFPISTVSFHKGNLLIGSLKGKNIVAMQGRFHYYEGYSLAEVTFPVRIFKELGVKNLLVSNAAGGLNLSYKKGDLVVINDHINLLPDNPLRGINEPELGERFVDMSEPYCKNLHNQLIEIANKNNVKLHSGVYVAVQGPNLETRAEYRWLRSMLADVVGMSTVPEIIVANQIGIKCLAVSVVTDECDPDNLQPINISEIIAVAGKADLILTKLYTEIIATL